jgi:hypothetical protein
MLSAFLTGACAFKKNAICNLPGYSFILKVFNFSIKIISNRIPQRVALLSGAAHPAL